MDEKARLNRITEAIIGAAVAVHHEVGAGMLESAYKECLDFELHSRGHQIEREKPLRLKYRDVFLDCAYRIDLLVDGAVVVEVKSMADKGRDQANRERVSGVIDGLCEFCGFCAKERER